MSKKNKNKKNILTLVKNIFQEVKGEEALEKLLELEKEYPSDIIIKQAISNSYLILGKHDDALQYSNLALEIDPDNYSVHYNLGTLYKKFKKNDEAIQFFKTSIELNKNFKEGFNSLGDIYFQMKSLSEAIKFYNKSYELDSEKSNEKTILNLAESYFLVSLKSTNIDELKKSKSFYEIFYKYNPDNQKVLGNLIFINSILGLKIDAIKLENQNDGIIIMKEDSKSIILRTK